MERDIKSMLNRKIREVEREPVTWNKAEVWMRIHDRVSTPTSNRKYYYVAAAVTFLLLCGVYTWWQNEGVSEANIGGAINDDKVPSEIHVEKNDVAGRPETAMKDHAEYVPPDNRMQPESQHITTTNNSQHQMATGEPETVSVEKPTTEDVKLSGEVIIATSTEVAEEERITPIVGVMELSDQQNVSHKSKRRRLFHKLESSESTFEDSFKNSIMIARTK